MADMLLHGATDYTGRLIEQSAKAPEIDLVLAGRSLDRVREVTRLLGFEARTAPLDARVAVAAALAGAKAVVNAAGPFSTTSRPMLDACLVAGVHYLDIIGEIDVLEAAAARGAQADPAYHQAQPEAAAQPAWL